MLVEFLFLVLSLFLFSAVLSYSFLSLCLSCRWRWLLPYISYDLCMIHDELVNSMTVILTYRVYQIACIAYEEPLSSSQTRSASLSNKKFSSCKALDRESVTQGPSQF